MRSNVAYLVVLMVMLACFTLFRLNPPGLIPLPGNLVLGALLGAGAVAVALRRPFSYPVGLASAFLATGGGLVSFFGWLGTLRLSQPVVWIVAGLYLAFRLTLNRHAEAEKKREE